MRIKLFGLVIFLLWFLFTPPKTFADNEFSSSYDVTYDVGTDGVTQVTQKVSLKNLTDQFYASNFTLTIGSTTVTDVVATDDSGVMETKVDFHKNEQGSSLNKTSIIVKFNQQVAGIDKVQTFVLKFKSKDFATVIGKTWEVNLPKIPDSDNLASYKLTLSVPVKFGDPTLISPQPQLETQSIDKLNFIFSKEQLGKSGVSVNFGTTQNFTFDIKYQLENDSLFPITTSVVLPPDTLYQDISLNKINPQPVNVTIDEDGNYLAWYRLPKRTNLKVSVQGLAKLYIKPKRQFQTLVSSKEKVEWTKTDNYWEKENPSIVVTLSEIFKDGVPQTNKEKARLIYRYVVNHLKYDIDRANSNSIERLGAITALSNPNSAVCMEFTDLFIALARAAEIPARELDGFAYSQNKDLRPLSLSRNLLHAWPEYYDEKNGWVMIDPTWENTSGGSDYFNKFDLNHLVLAVKGFSSTTPYVSNNVSVEVSEADFAGSPQIEPFIDIDDNLWAGLPASGTVKVFNRGSIVQEPSTLILKSNQAVILGDSSANLGSIPPAGFVEYNFNIKSPLIWEEAEDTLEVSVGGQKFTKQMIIKPFFLFLPLPYVLGGAIGLIVIIYLLTLGLHWRSKRKPEKN